MATVHRERGFTFHVFSNDHQPAHVHVKKNGGKVKLDISNKQGTELLCIEARMSSTDIGKALDIADDHIKKFRTKWEEYHGPID